ncbi:MAG: hypothetical protein ABIP50_02400 [Candidatus Saccharimonadales bacterium]
MSFNPVEDIVWSADVSLERLLNELAIALPVTHLKLTDALALKPMLSGLSEGKAGVDISFRFLWLQYS